MTLVDRMKETAETTFVIAASRWASMLLVPLVGYLAFTITDTASGLRETKAHLEAVAQRVERLEATEAENRAYREARRLERDRQHLDLVSRLASAEQTLRIIVATQADMRGDIKELSARLPAKAAHR